VNQNRAQKRILIFDKLN